MSNSAPIIPPGSPLQRTRSDRDSRLFVTVFAVLAIHVLLLAGLLIQGCKREDRNASATPGNTLSNLTESSPLPPLARTAPETPSAPPTAVATTPASPAGAPDTARVEPRPALPGATEPTVAAARPASPASPAVVAPAAFEGETTIYSVKPGDNLTKIARAHGTTVRAIRAVNGLKTDRITVGQKLKVPAVKAPADSNTSATAATSTNPVATDHR
jgi:LysM repeat protein